VQLRCGRATARASPTSIGAIGAQLWAGSASVACGADPLWAEPVEVAYRAPAPGYDSAEVAYGSEQVACDSVEVGYASAEVGYDSAEVGYDSAEVAYDSAEVAYDLPWSSTWGSAHLHEPAGRGRASVRLAAAPSRAGDAHPASALIPLNEGGLHMPRSGGRPGRCYARRRAPPPVTYRATLLVGTLCTAMGAACAHDGASDGEPVTEATFIGTLDGSNVRIAVVRGRSTLQAYVCGAGDTLATHTRWFRGRVPGDGGAIELRESSWDLRIESAGAGLAGELQSPDGLVQSWSASRVADTADGMVGLYDASQDGCRTGVIVWRAPPGAACDAQGSYCDASGQRSQVEPVLCAAGQPLRVRAVGDAQDVELTVARVHVP